MCTVFSNSKSDSEMDRNNKPYTFSYSDEDKRCKYVFFAYNFYINITFIYICNTLCTEKKAKHRREICLQWVLQCFDRFKTWVNLNCIVAYIKRKLFDDTDSVLLLSTNVVHKLYKFDEIILQTTTEGVFAQLAINSLPSCGSESFIFRAQFFYYKKHFLFEMNFNEISYSFDLILMQNS